MSSSATSAASTPASSNTNPSANSNTNPKPGEAPASLDQNSWPRDNHDPLQPAIAKTSRALNTSSRDFGTSPISDVKNRRRASLYSPYFNRSPSNRPPPIVRADGNPLPTIVDEVAGTGICHQAEAPALLPFDPDVLKYRCTWARLRRPSLVTEEPTQRPKFVGDLHTNTSGMSRQVWMAIHKGKTSTLSWQEAASGSPHPSSKLQDYVLSLEHPLSPAWILRKRTGSVGPSQAAK
ncbi:hypothetical protein FRB90_002067 [Tulasnella sp. 427]|nr:hypothetical protein FRB90_002067 [Tulasnella sp. 427]